MYDDVNKINKRRLDNYYIGLYFYRYTFTISSDSDVSNLVVYFVVGCDVLSRRKLLLVKKGRVLCLVDLYIFKLV
ncbi:MAG: hypothetical protein RSE45_00820 [Bacilli bacterium]